MDELSTHATPMMKQILAGAPGFEPGNGGIKIRPAALI
jgi:hypothetical protein